MIWIYFFTERRPLDLIIGIAALVGTIFPVVSVPYFMAVWFRVLNYEHWYNPMKIFLQFRLGSEKQKVFDKRWLKVGQSYELVSSSKIIARIRFSLMLGLVLASGRDDVKFAPLFGPIFNHLLSSTFYFSLSNSFRAARPWSWTAPPIYLSLALEARVDTSKASASPMSCCRLNKFFVEYLEPLIPLIHFQSIPTQAITDVKFCIFSLLRSFFLKVKYI